MIATPIKHDSQVPLAAIFSWRLNCDLTPTPSRTKPTTRINPDMGQRASLPQPGATIQVIGAGLPRTGTASFSLALAILLGGPVYHGGTQSTLGPPPQIQAWMQIMRMKLHGQPGDRPAMLELLHAELDGYAAITDSPGSQFVPELMELYPDAKVVCTVRDPEPWTNSMHHVINMIVIWFMRIVLLPLPGMRHWIDYCILIGNLWERMYGEALPTAQTYHRHIAWLKEVVPPDRLVFFDVRDGWEPLCKALGRDVPLDCPFPHVNDADTMYQVARYHIRRGLTRWAIIIAVGAVGVAWALR